MSQKRKLKKQHRQEVRRLRELKKINKDDNRKSKTNLEHRKKKAGG